jgi:hypothetical protein
MTPELPPGMTEGIYTDIHGGKVRVHLIKNKRSVGYVDMDGAALGGAAATLLQAAYVAARQSGAAPLSGIESSVPYLLVATSSMGLASNAAPGFETIVMRSGEAQIGFPVPHEGLKRLGQALLAASAGIQKTN